jgi:hypothetical protein
MTIGHWTNWTTGGNALAKDYLAITKTQPRCYEVPYEPWSIWHKGKKTVQPSNTIYKIIHREEAIKYWERKDKVILELLGNVSWEAIGGAMQTSGCPRQHFVYGGHVWNGKKHEALETLVYDTCPRSRRRRACMAVQR